MRPEVQVLLGPPEHARTTPAAQRDRFNKGVVSVSRRPVVLLVAAGTLATLLRRRKMTKSSERELWTEATSAPDLR